MVRRRERDLQRRGEGLERAVDHDGPLHRRVQGQPPQVGDRLQLVNLPAESPLELALGGHIARHDADPDQLCVTGK